MINRANCNLKLSKPKLLTASAWRGSYLSHNSIFKEQQVFPPKSPMLKTRSVFPFRDKKTERRITSLNSASQIRVLKRRDYFLPRRLSTAFLFVEVYSRHQNATDAKKIAAAIFLCKRFFFRQRASKCPRLCVSADSPPMKPQNLNISRIASVPSKNRNKLPFIPRDFRVN